MVSAEPDEGVYHSITYYQNEGGDDWYTLTDGEENLHEYMVHAYLSTETGIDDGFSSTPKEMTLYQNAPNPFNASTTISYRLPDPGHVSLRLYDLLGRERSILIDEQQASGLHRFTFEAGPLHSGIYIYRLTAGRFSQTKKLTILR